jgi:hypothetical protein
MHLDADERARAFPVIAGLVAPGGRLFISLRHGPVPPGRRMFEIAADEVIAQAAAEGLSLIQQARNESITEPNRSQGVTWTRLGFERVGA